MLLINIKKGTMLNQLLFRLMLKKSEYRQELSNYQKIQIQKKKIIKQERKIELRNQRKLVVKMLNLKLIPLLIEVSTLDSTFLLLVFFGFGVLSSFLVLLFSSSGFGFSDNCLIPNDIRSFSTSIETIIDSTSSPFLYLLTALSPFSVQDISER